MKKCITMVIITLLIAGCSNRQEIKDERILPIKVTIGTVQVTNSYQEFRYSGIIEASQTIPLTFQTTGIVEQVLVQEGDVVKKGDLLAGINKQDMQSIYNSSLAVYNRAKDGYDRMKQVYEKGSLPEVKWIEMETNLKNAESQLEVAKHSLDKCNLYSPANAIVGRRNIEPGQSAVTTLAPIELVKIENVQVKISVPENEISRIKKGLKAGINVSALDGRNFEGSVTNVSPVAETLSRTYTVKITVQNPKSELKPGMICDVNLKNNSKEELLIIPYKAVKQGTDGKTYVFVVMDNNRVKKQNVVVGNYNSSGIEVINGLTAGQRVVCGGSDKLSDNSLITL